MASSSHSSAGAFLAVAALWQEGQSSGGGHWTFGDAGSPAWLSASSSARRALTCKPTPLSKNAWLRHQIYKKNNPISVVLTGTAFRISIFDKKDRAQQGSLEGGLNVMERMEIRFQGPALQSASSSARRASPRKATAPHSHYAMVCTDYRCAFTWEVMPFPSLSVGMD